MRLALHTDFSLRVMMFLASMEAEERATTRALAEKFKVSENHLHKVVQSLARLGVIQSTAGRNGGIRLAHPAKAISVGWLIRELEGIGKLVDCTIGPCPLNPACVLKGALARAEAAFFGALDPVTLADVVSERRTTSILQFMRQP
ncbi:Rrf2 family transcriptional regulator [Herbaspirillum sp. LeCh32-8]|uniref:RrF2 family transcriptional regulator n=1 Tax=Herbaspirillum sp. LeCh32-8 TaxID=2821356 RepID=UPI001AE2F1C7|nr:Rrf2 family transcriptional regulator [Herbaspirillum sp. LeCh32-8]MBP0600651.1 Rrf2 family transcriptional regulator [Herbaspirillum sp. LeCh32-8]